MAAATSEDELLSKIIETAGWVGGWRLYHVRDSKHAVIQGVRPEGFPDLVLVRRAAGGDRGRVLFRELKREGKDPTADQAEWGAMLLAAGQDWGVWRPSDWPAIERELRGQVATPAERTPLPVGSASLRYRPAR